MSQAVTIIWDVEWTWVLCLVDHSRSNRPTGLTVVDQVEVGSCLVDQFKLIRPTGLTVIYRPGRDNFRENHFRSNAKRSIERIDLGSKVGVRFLVVWTTSD